MKVSGAVAIVTGGVSGIGKAICQKLLENGAKVCIIDIQDEAGTALAAQFAATFSSDHVMFVHCDVTRRENLAAAFEKTVATFGGLDIVCNNAGRVYEREWEKAIQLNVLGTMTGMELAIQRMGRQHGGHGGVILNTASTGGLYAFPSMPVYCSTKAAICMYVKCMADRTLAEQGVRISAICPGMVDTPLIEVAIQEAVIGEKQMRHDVEAYYTLTPQEVADAAFHLITDDTKNGTLLQVFASGWEEYQFPEMPASKIGAVKPAETTTN